MSAVPTVLAVSTGVVVIVIAIAVVLVVLIVAVSMRGRQKRAAERRAETRHRPDESRGQGGGDDLPPDY
jgi:heme/copper-type cytochrome/quinol oxidase subunit 2